MTRYVAGIALLAACASAGITPGDVEVCTGFPPWEGSSYVLPFPVGRQYTMDQTNCSPPGNGHRGVGRYAYDFLMPIGTLITAARAGTVLHVEQSHADGQIADTGLENYVAIAHPDGTVDIYGHITLNGARVVTGQSVAQGDTVAFSGNTGNTNNIPHLHLSQHTCDPVTRGSAACATMPVTFRNTTANPEGLTRGGTYRALAY